MTGKKLGRPTEQPKPHKITVRLDDDSLRKLLAYCAQQHVERSEGVRQAIQLLKIDQ